MDESSETVIKTSATALYKILFDVRANEEASLSEAWEEVLGVKWNTADFAVRHAAVMNLWWDVCIEIKDLELESLRRRMERYTAIWWNAIVAPDHPWGTMKGDDVISVPDLDMLATVGELIEARLEDSSSLSSQQYGLERLREECVGWLEFIGTTEEISEESVRQTLVMQIGHLIWLVDNVNIFGLHRIVNQGDQITGVLIRSRTQQDDVKNTRRFRDRLASFVAALTLVANLIHSSQTVYDAADHALPGAERIIRELTSQSSGDVKPFQKDGDK